MGIVDKIKIIIVNAHYILLIGVILSVIATCLGAISYAQNNPTDSNYKRLEEPQSEDYYKTIQSQSIQKNYWKMRKKISTASVGLWSGTSRTPDYSPEFIPYSRGYDYLLKGQWDQAIAAFNEAIKITPKHGESYINRGLAYGSKGQYEQAVADFSKFISWDPKDAGAYYNRGLAYALKGQHEAALADLDKALALAPRDAQTLFLRGFVYFKQGQADRARADYQTALGLNPDWVSQSSSRDEGELSNFALIMEGKKVPARQGSRKQESGRTILSHSTQGNYWKMRKKISTASVGLWSGTSRTPDYSPEFIPYSSGYDYLMKGQWDQAIAAFNEAIKITPKHGESYINRGLAYGSKGQYEQAVADFSKFISWDPMDAGAYYNRALAYALQGQYDAALADLDKALRLAPKDAKTFYLRGFVYFKKNQTDLARADYQSAMRLNPDWVSQISSRDEGELSNFALIMEGKKAPAQQDKEHKHKGKALAQQGEYVQALGELDQALALDPKDAENFTRRGGIYTLQKQYDKAINDFNRALELDPRYAKAYYNRALVYYHQGKYDQTLADLHKTLELKPKDAEAYHNRGLVYIQKNDFGKAIDDFNMAIALNPKLADAYFNKAAACERAGRRAEAQEAYAAYLKVAPPGAKAQIEQARDRVNQR
jgi:tetratricopeptide (TPR) repeat protein